MGKRIRLDTMVIPTTAIIQIDLAGVCTAQDTVFCKILVIVSCPGNYNLIIFDKKDFQASTIEPH